MALSSDINRRAFTLGMAAVAVPAAKAQDYPSRPIRIIVSLGAGSTSDVIARVVAADASKRLKTPIIVENRPGAGTRLGAELVTQALPDGYTLLGSGAGLSNHKVVFKALPYDPMKDLKPVIILVDNIFVVVVDARLPVKTLRDFVEYAKANPGKLNYGSVGKNVMLGIEAFKDRAGFAMTEVPYKGGADLNAALLTGQIHFANNPVTVIKPFLDDGRFRALAVLSPTRLPMLPDVPTAAEAGYPYYISPAWSGLFAPAKTPDAIVQKLHEAFAASLADPAIAAQMERLGAVVLATPPAQAYRRMQEEEQMWINTARTVKLEPE